MIYLGPDPRESAAVTAEREEQQRAADDQGRGEPRHPTDDHYDGPSIEGLAEHHRLRNDVDDPADPWEPFQCQRCDETYQGTYCAHGRYLCASCAAFGCQSCEAEEADMAAIIEQRNDEWWESA